MSVQPSCFGRRWDPNDVECKGGLDPLYSNPVNGTKHRDKCSWFNSCSQATNNKAAQPSLLPTTSLLQKVVATTTPSVRAPQMPPAHIPPPSPPVMPPRPAFNGSATHYSLPSGYSPPTPQIPQAPQQMAQMHHMPMYQQPVQQSFAPPNVAQYGPAMVAMPFQNPGSQMPQYLTVPEPANDRVHWALRLGRELLRSMVKAFGHQLAAHVDSHSIQRHD